MLPPGATPASAIALTLRAVGGLTTAEIARAFLVGEATMAQRITRAKQRIEESGMPFRLPERNEQTVRLPAVLHVASCTGCSRTTRKRPGCWRSCS